MIMSEKSLPYETLIDQYIDATLRNVSELKSVVGASSSPDRRNHAAADGQATGAMSRHLIRAFGLIDAVETAERAFPTAVNDQITDAVTQSNCNPIDRIAKLENALIEVVGYLSRERGLRISGKIQEFADSVTGRGESEIRTALSRLERKIDDMASRMK